MSKRSKQYVHLKKIHQLAKNNEPSLTINEDNHEINNQEIEILDFDTLCSTKKPSLVECAFATLVSGQFYSSTSK